MTLIKQCEAKNVVLVHGEAKKMEFLEAKIKEEFNLDCFHPANGETLVINTQTSLPVDVELGFLKRTLDAETMDPKRQKLLHGTLTIRSEEDNGRQDYKLESKEKLAEFGIEPHQIMFKTYFKPQPDMKSKVISPEDIAAVIHSKLLGYVLAFYIAILL